MCLKQSLAHKEVLASLDAMPSTRRVCETTRRRMAYYGLPRVVFPIIAYLLSLGIERDLDCVELFSGAGALNHAFQDLGMTSDKLDVELNPLHDMNKTPGILHALKLCLRLKVGGILWCGVPCSTWVFMSRGSTGRSAGAPLGRETSPAVVAANILASRVVVCILVAVARGAMWCVEQPSSSLLERHPRFRLLEQLSA